MKFLPILAALCTAAVAAPAPPPPPPTAHITYDVHYGNANYPLSQVACSNGPHGLLTRGKSSISCGLGSQQILSLRRIHHRWPVAYIPESRRVHEHHLGLSTLRHLLEAHVQGQEHQRPPEQVSRRCRRRDSRSGCSLSQDIRGAATCAAVHQRG